MGHLTGEIITMHCKICQEKRIHHEISEDGVSAGKVIGGVMTYGLSLLVTGIKGKNNKKTYMCNVCQSVNE